MRNWLGPVGWIVAGLAAAATVVDGVLAVTGASDVATFILGAVALAGTAWVMSEATDAVGRRLRPALAGVLQATLGNLPEFFVVLFALRAGHLVVAQTALLGSIFANGMLVLGLVIVTGARVSEDRIMRFHRRLPRDTATLLLLAVFLIGLLGLSVEAGVRAGRHPEAISVVGALCLLGVYALWMPQYLSESKAELTSGEGARIPFGPAVGLLAGAAVASALVSDWFVGALEPSLGSLHLSEEFAGLVIAAIAGNAAEQLASVVQAARGRSDLAIGIVQNSVTQVALFLFPVLVLVSLLLSTHLTFVVQPVYIGALVLMAVTLWQITGDGQAYQFEGAALVALYLILALIAYFS